MIAEIEAKIELDKSEADALMDMLCEVVDNRDISFIGLSPSAKGPGMRLAFRAFGKDGVKAAMAILAKCGGEK